MFTFSNILAQSQANIQLVTADIIVLVICGLGVVFLVNWFISYSGPAALAAAPVRRNRLPYPLPFIQIGVWITLTVLAGVIVQGLGADMAQWQQELATYAAVTVIEVVMIVSFCFFGWRMFARRLKGFGLDWRTIGKDLPAAMINLISIMPLVLSAIWLVVWLGKVFTGTDFQMPANPGLTVIIENSQLPLRLLMFGFVVVVVPVFEEMLFRGFFQSMIKGFFGGPWRAIFISSAAFAMLHPWMHFLPLFVLSVCIGYAYEKSGSLFRPIFIHAMFNAVSITMALLAES